MTLQFSHTIFNDRPIGCTTIDLRKITLRYVAAKTFAFFGLAVANPAHADLSLGDDWRDTFTRCRISIETGTPPRTDDMMAGTREDAAQFAEPPQTVKDGNRTIRMTPGREAPNTLWKSATGQFWLLGREYVSRGDGAVRRSCKVVPVAPVDQATANGLREQFEAERAALVDGGSHIDVDLIDLPSLELHAFAPTKRSPTDFCVISTFSVSSEDDMETWKVLSGTGEQVEGICSTEDTQ